MELVILEVSGKQQYIFGSKKLRENALRSDEINYVTSSAFFNDAAKEYYVENENMVYSGGGHTILQFENHAKARNFIDAVTNAALHRFPEIELFAKIEEYRENDTPGKNLKYLASCLEAKKALRKSSFRQLSFGLEELSVVNNQPKDLVHSLFVKNNSYKEIVMSENKLLPPDGWEYPSEFKSIKVKKDKESKKEKTNFIAVVHIDGNAMGKRVDNIYETCSDPKKWNNCCKKLRSFSENIQKDFEDTFLETVGEVINQINRGTFASVEDKILPIRPVILAGDDVCFVTAGNIGLECARVFLEKLSEKTNEEDGKKYSACAGVAIVHEKYPFYRAYDLSEALCSNAKKTGSLYNEDGSISMIDWHIEFGQLKDGLDQLREDYNTEDGKGRLELRPYVIKGDAENIKKVRRYEFFKAMVGSIASEAGKTARGKIKNMREAFKQGELESEFAMHDKQIEDLLNHVITSKYADDWLRQMLRANSNNGFKYAFEDCDEGGIKRCLFFDAIEVVDHFIAFE